MNQYTYDLLKNLVIFFSSSSREMFLKDPGKIADLKRSMNFLKVLKKDPDEINYTSRKVLSNFEKIW